MVLAQVSKTAILTLRARADEQQRPDPCVVDPTAVAWLAQLSWPPELDGWYQPDAQLALALRADDVDRIVRRYVAAAQPRSIVELGCGLSTRRQRLPELAHLAWLDLDLPPLIAVREALGAPPPHRGCSVLDPSWISSLPAGPDHLFIAEGLFYYLPRAEVDALLTAMAQRFEGSALLFDVVGATDYPKLLENSRSVGAPITWKLERDFDEVLLDFGLEPIPQLTPDQLMHEALTRYWERFDRRTQGLIYFAMNTPEVWARRSGMVLGRLGPHTGRRIS